MSSSEDLSSAEFHKNELSKHCRVCGKRFAWGARQESKEKELFTTCYEVDIDNDNAEVHPPHVYYRCTSKMRRIKVTKDASGFVRLLFLSGRLTLIAVVYMHTLQQHTLWWSPQKATSSGCKWHQPVSSDGFLSSFEGRSCLHCVPGNSRHACAAPLRPPGLCSLHQTAHSL